MENVNEKSTVPLWRKIAFALLMMLCSAFIVHGIGLLDIEEVLANATVLCLSCVGIG